MLKKDGSTFYQNNVLSDLDRAWLNYFYLPYIARSDVYRELDDVVYDGNNNVLTEAQRLELQAALMEIQHLLQVEEYLMYIKK